MSIDSTAGSQVHIFIPLEIFAEEEEDAFIYNIREEIIQNVMSEIHEIYLKRQLYNLVVDCAHEAFSKLISFEFYHHNPLPDLTRGWLYYRTEKTSDPDSWACRNLHSSAAPATCEPAETNASETTEAVCTCDPAMSCSCQKRDKEIRHYVDILNFDYSAASSMHSIEVTALPDKPSIHAQTTSSVQCEVEQGGSVTSGSVDVGIDKVLKAVDSRNSVLFPKLALTKAPVSPEEQKVCKVEPLPPIRVEMDFEDRPKSSAYSSFNKRFMKLK